MCSRNNKHVHLFMYPYTPRPNTYSHWTCLLETNLHLRLMYPYTPRPNIYSHWTCLLETNLHLLMYPYTPRPNTYSHWTCLLERLLTWSKVGSDRNHLVRQDSSCWLVDKNAGGCTCVKRLSIKCYLLLLLMRIKVCGCRNHPVILQTETPPCFVRH